MNRRHEHVLADIQDRVHTRGASLDEVDAAIAEELGVPVDYYFAYLLVWDAIKAYRHTQALADPGRLQPGTGHGEAVAACRGQVDRIGLLSARIYQQVVELSPLASEMADRAGEILGAVLLLRKHLHELGAEPARQAPGQRGDGNGQAVGS